MKSKRHILIFLIIFLINHGQTYDIKKSVRLEDGKRILTNGYCTTVMNAHDFIYLGDIYSRLDAVDPGVIHNCKNIKTFQIINTRITKLPPDTFLNSTKLQNVYLFCNQISELSEGLFAPLVDLKRLLLGGNPIKTLQPIFTSNLHALTQLEVDGCDLTRDSLNFELITKNFPALQVIGYYFNFLSCREQAVLDDRFAAARINREPTVLECEKIGAKQCFNHLEMMLFESLVNRRNSELGLLTKQGWSGDENTATRAPCETKATKTDEIIFSQIDVRVNEA